MGKIDRSTKGIFSTTAQGVGALDFAGLLNIGAPYQHKIHIEHEGIDTVNVKPAAEASFTLPGTGLTLTADDEAVTYVARNLEPYRGFPSLMRRMPAILAARPKAK